MKQRTWFITGINSGFGRHMTEQLLERGDKVAGTVRDMNSVDDLKAKYGELLWVSHLDVTDIPEIYEVINKAFQQLGTIDIIVSNAGYGLFGAAEEFTNDQIIHQINTNLVGPIQLIRAALPHLRSQNSGRIIQLSSVAGQVASPGGSLYHATKWGIEGFIEALMQELAPFNISLTLVEPGGARTNFLKGSLKLADKLDAYETSPASFIRRVVENNAAAPLGDPLKMVKIMIDSVDRNPAPKRIVLGSESYYAIHQALSSRIEELESQKEQALSTDFPSTK
ncbi:MULTISPECIES: SDR family oxidoreductase [unclassified Dehalobacter]|uniref:SDR family oxidoreductase n=1 Tax=unclassified Dehalobacter TaxID=2635733 RepID=UPI0003AA1806|nr:MULTISPECIES: SDR family oxidoreductase [unclassified Dehalobacter]RJE48995.1 short-chain dehydrogenase/reductase [Dehalobacter sp. MCB1]TCX51735.1 KR domain-containing protein [Dehalobacter sp. 14DCB1]TCX52795.1 KR domain-containing protein [Dehalobacter sp. 12DCB1]